MTWRARSASDQTDNWSHWYVTRDTPPDCNETPEAYRLATGQAWPPILPFLTKGLAQALAAKLNGGVDNG